MSRAPAPSRRPSSSRRGWLPHQQRASAPLAALRSEADPTGFQPLRSSPCFAKRRLHNRPSHAQSSGQGPGVVVRDVFSRGMAAVQAWPPGLDHRRPFFLTSTLARGVYVQLPIPVPQMRSGLPRYVPPSAHDSWQVLLFQGQSCSHFQVIYQLRRSHCPYFSANNNTSSIIPYSIASVALMK